ncbi:hypothetical protein F8388_026951, partial [Cannabis sativa]
SVCSLKKLGSFVAQFVSTASAETLQRSDPRIGVFLSLFTKDSRERLEMFDDQDLGFVANFLGIFIFVLVIAYHYVMADPKYEGS